MTRFRWGTCTPNKEIKKYAIKLLLEDLPDLKEDILPDDVVSKYNEFKNELRKFVAEANNNDFSRV